MAYIDEAKKSGLPSYFVFRGETDDGSTTEDVAWATRSIAESGAMIEPRLKVGSGIVRAFPQTLGGRPSLCSVTLTLDNSDDALREFLIGSTSSDPRDEYSGHGVLNLTGKLYHGVIAEDGTHYESALTPTLYLAGSPTYDGHVVQLPMASDDDKILGRSRFALTIREIKRSKPGTDGTDPADGVATTGAYYTTAAGGSTGSLTQDEAAADFGDWTEGLDAPARYIYGPALLPLIRTHMEVFAADGRKRVQFFCFITMKEPKLSDFEDWIFSRSNSWDGVPVATLQGHRINKIQRWVLDSDRAWKLVWVVWLKQGFLGKKAGTDAQYQDEELWLSGLPPHLGLASNPSAADKTEFASPANVIKRIVEDHSRGGTAVIDSTSFTRARKAIPYNDLCCGLYNGDAPIADIVSHIANGFGLTLWVGTDDKLRVSVTGSFTQEDLATVDAGGLDELTRADVLGEWTEIIPRVQGERGAAVNRVTVDWTDEQRRFYGKERLAQRYRANTQLPLGAIREARISGAWMKADPGRVIFALSRYAGTFAFVARRIRFRTRLWVASRELGTLMYLTHRRGLESVAGGFARRLVRLEAVDVDPDRRNCLAIFEDLGPVANLRFGLLDDYANWIAATPTAGANTITVTAASTNVSSSADIFTGMAGNCLNLRGSANANNRRTRKIVSVTDARNAVVDFAYGTNEALAAAGSGMSAAWIIEYTHETMADAARKAKYIQVARESDGLFQDDTEGFSYEAA